MSRNIKEYEHAFHGFIFAICLLGLDNGRIVRSNDNTLTPANYTQCAKDFVIQYINTNTNNICE